jgi:hypothetical protein
LKFCCTIASVFPIENIDPAEFKKYVIIVGMSNASSYHLGKGVLQPHLMPPEAPLAG